MFRMPETTQFFTTMETLSEAYKEFYESECPIGAFSESYPRRGKNLFDRQKSANGASLLLRLRNFKRRDGQSL